MRNTKMILAVVIAVLVVGGAWWVIADSTLRVVTNDVNYEATFEITYNDGSTVEVKRYKTASIMYEGKVVNYVTFDLDAKFKAKQMEDVRLLSPRSGGEQETKVTFYVKDPVFGNEKVSEYPLSATTNTDYSVLDTGTWYNVFKDLKITTTQMDDALTDFGQTSFSILAVVDVWYNLDPDKSEIIHHEIIFEVPFKILDITNEVPDPDGGGGGGDGDRRNQPISSNPIQPDQPQKPTVKISDPVNTQYAPWTVNIDQSSYKNLGKR